MVKDCHVHIGSGLHEKGQFIKNLGEADVAKAILLSYPPDYFNIFEPHKPEDKLMMLMEWARYCPEKIVPFYWVNPMEDSASEQIDRALEEGIAGFKVICGNHYPCEDKAMRVYEKIARAGKPMLFHSGILYSNGPSSVYNRPANFEGLFDVPDLRFALAHVSWPWHDECLAVYGKWCHEKGLGRTTSEMFIDTTPGTPPIYREEVLSKIYNIGYDVENNVMFGTDCMSDYNVTYSSKIVERDTKILDKLELMQEVKEKYFSGNFDRFIGIL